MLPGAPPSVDTDTPTCNHIGNAMSSPKREVALGGPRPRVLGAIGRVATGARLGLLNHAPGPRCERRWGRPGAALILL